ncbi:ASCH domain [Serratia marcescens]|uniref:ASCH domain n=1 Tax=Serratia marcescens TaxID=615 RepID=A0A379Z9I2_SERMA|nr:ASCH domain [Serratia marcescens]
MRTAYFFCFIEVLSVTPVRLDALTERHAQQENMSLGELKQVIKEIYPGLDALFVIEFVKR